MYIAGTGEKIDCAIREVKENLPQGGHQTLMYDDIFITVSSDSNENDLVIIYQLKKCIRELTHKTNNLEN